MNGDFLSIQPEWAQFPRLVQLDGAFNLRDLGGYPTADGGFTACGKVFRSDDLHSLTPNDIRELEKKGLRTIIDFRAEGERHAAPDAALQTVVNDIHLPIDPANVTTLKNTLISVDAGLMIKIYHLLVREFQPTYRRFFEIVQNEAASPLLFHCSGGKDRTGLAAALFLSAAGVSREVIMNDYLVSRERAELKYAKEIKLKPELAPLLTVKPEYLEAAFDVIDEEFGGMDAYLTNQLGVDPKLIRQMYTSPSLNGETV